MNATTPAHPLPTAPLNPAAGEPDVTGVIAQLFVYPVKSCAGVAVQEAMLTQTGLEFDRAWMVVDEQGGFLTQRELPRMALVQPRLRHHDMVLRAPGMLALHVALDEVEEPVQVSVWGQPVAAYDMGATAARWFSDFLGVKARLVRFDPAHKRPSSMAWTGGVEALNQFSDGYPLLIISQASLDGLNARLQSAGAPAVGIARFRPNIVLGNGLAATDASSPNSSSSLQTLEAHDEDRMDVLALETAQGLVRLQPVKPCPRCPIVNIDPATATSSTTVNDALQTYRQDARLDGALSFGMNAMALDGSEALLRVGQRMSATFRFT